MKISKEQLLQNLRERIEKVKEAIMNELERVGKTALKSEADISRIRKGEREHALMLRAQAIVRYKELQSITASPFFFKCVIAHKTLDVRHQAAKEIYFGKYELSEQGIYSWIAPIAVVRFANPGDTSFKLPNGNVKEITLHEKEQYMIVDGKVMFYSHESITHPRELIYQEHFSIKKGAFMLPEIVEVMEKAQDDVIRASHFGPFAIAGPAGSGKTTLALHRVAYLVQAPEHAELYPSHSILVFVQDSGTKEYFAHLLPELGINNVKITTFFEWASEILKMEDVSFVQNTECELEKLLLKNSIVAGEVLPQKEKKASLKINNVEIMWNKNIFQTLENLYAKSGSEDLIKSFSNQKKNLIVDRIDITLALMIFKKHKKRLQIETESNRVMRLGKIVRHTHTDVLNYSLVVVDEFQNYLPEQLDLFKSCLKEETQSIIYVGDMSQKINHGTVKTWQDFNEAISSDRQIMLHKVYRNTKQILKYIASLGFNVTTPGSLKEGLDVFEKFFENEDIAETSAYIFELLKKSKTSADPASVGVLSFDKDFVNKLRQNPKFSDYKNLKILTVPEAQGVEFDIVCIVGVHKDMFKLPSKYSQFPDFKEEKQKIYKDLLYIALTRPMLEMHILGTCTLKEVMEY